MPLLSLDLLRCQKDVNIGVHSKTQRIRVKRLGFAVDTKNPIINGNKIGIGWEVRLRIESTSGSTGGSEEGAD